MQIQKTMAISAHFFLHVRSSADHSKQQTSWINCIFLSELEHSSSADKPSWLSITTALLGASETAEPLIMVCFSVGVEYRQILLPLRKSSLVTFIDKEIYLYSDFEHFFSDNSYLEWQIHKISEVEYVHIEEAIVSIISFPFYHSLSFLVYSQQSSRFRK